MLVSPFVTLHVVVSHESGERTPEDLCLLSQQVDVMARSVGASIIVGSSNVGLYLKVSRLSGCNRGARVGTAPS